MRTDRVVLVTPYPPKKDGLASYGYDLACALAAEVEVTVVTQRVEASPPGPVPVLPVFSAGPASVIRLVRAVQRFRPTVLHVQFTIPGWGVQTLWLLLAVAWLRRTRRLSVVWTLHEVVREVATLRGMGRALYRVIDRLADLHVVLSEVSADCLVTRCGAAPGRIVVMPHGVPVRPTPTAPAPDRSAGPVVFFGYLHPDKGIEHLLDAVRLLRLRGRTSPDLLIAGAVRPRRGAFRMFERQDHDYERWLRSTAPAGTRFLGYLEDDALDELLRSAQVVVFPYLSVTQSGAINRALALGCPVVASDLSGLSEDVPHPAGLVPAGDAEALADAVIAVVDADNRRRTMADASAALAAERSAQRGAMRLRTLYATVTRGGLP